MRNRLITAICGATLGAILLAPGSAGAVVSCPAPAAGVLTITVTMTSTLVSIDRSGADIRAFDGEIGSGGDQCAAGDVTTNVDTINVVDNTASGSLTLVVSLQGGRFEPGMTAEPTGGSEIEITYTAGADSDVLVIRGSDGVDTFDHGQAAASAPQVDLNPPGDANAPDCDDVTGTGVDQLFAQGRGGEDDLNASGCGAFAALDLTVLVIEGNNEKDFLRGGPGDDSVLGGTQDDNVNGGAGEDSVYGGDHDDKLDGGTNSDNLEGDNGTDRALYDDRTTPLTVTIGNGGADDGGAEDQDARGRDNVGTTTEHVTGGAANDSITGSSVRNVLNGGLGDDFMLGGAGNDDVEGEGGNDTVDGEEGNDEPRGGDGTDTVRGGKGSDDLFGGASADKLRGGAGGDVLKGNKGKDKFSGQAGADTLNAKDKKKDRKISCGKGRASKERAKVDKVDPKARSC